MRLSLVTDRLSLNLPACTSARLRCATTLQPSERQSSHRYCCNCSSAASTSGATDEEQLSTFGCIRHATRAVKHAYRLCQSQRQELEASQLSDSFLHVPGKGTSVGSVRWLPPVSNMCLMLGIAVLPGNGFADLGRNYVFMAGFWGWFLAQTCKVPVKSLQYTPTWVTHEEVQYMQIFTKRWRKGVWDLKAIVDSGGMPSSHSALCSAVTTATAMEFGLGSSLFAVSLAFSSIVMYDAAGVRRHAGKQAEVLNILLEDLLEGHAVSETKLKEVLGHTPIQVCVGALLGLLVGIFFPIPRAMLVV